MIESRRGRWSRPPPRLGDLGELRADSDRLAGGEQDLRKGSAGYGWFKTRSRRRGPPRVDAIVRSGIRAPLTRSQMLRGRMRLALAERLPPLVQSNRKSDGPFAS